MSEEFAELAVWTINTYTPWQFGSCGWISPAKIFEIALSREFEPRLKKLLEFARIEAALRCMFIFIILARRSAKYFSYEVRVISKWLATIEKGKSLWPAKYYPLELEGHYPNISSKSGHMPNLWRFSSQRGF